MPTYTFKHKKSGKEVTKNMTIAEGEAWHKAHPQYDWLCGLPGIGDPFRMGRVKPPEVHRDRLREIKKSFPGADFESSFT